MSIFTVIWSSIASDSNWLLSASHSKLLNSIAVKEISIKARCTKRSFEFLSHINYCGLIVWSRNHAYTFQFIELANCLSFFFRPPHLHPLSKLNHFSAFNWIFIALRLLREIFMNVWVEKPLIIEEMKSRPPSTLVRAIKLILFQLMISIFDIFVLCVSDGNFSTQRLAVMKACLKSEEVDEEKQIKREIGVEYVDK